MLNRSKQKKFYIFCFKHLINKQMRVCFTPWRENNFIKYQANPVTL